MFIRERPRYEHLWEDKEAGWERNHTVVQVPYSLSQPDGEAQAQMAHPFAQVVLCWAEKAEPSYSPVIRWAPLSPSLGMTLGKVALCS